MSHTVDVPFFPYRIFFLFIEPISAILGSIYAGQPAKYLSLITLNPQPLNVQRPSTPVEIALYQLSNLYLLFALNEFLVLSSTRSLKTWRRLLLCLLIADFGHLATMFPLGHEVYWRFWDWNAMVWGSVGFVYAGALTRIAFLMGLGLGGSEMRRKRVQ